MTLAIAMIPGAPTRLLAVVLAAQTPASPPSPMFRGNPAHTGVAAERLFGGQGGVRWRYSTGGAVRSSPAVTTRRLFVGSADGHLYALERTGGKLAWKFDAGGIISSSPAVSGGLVVAATYQGRIFAVDERTGRLRWSMRTGAALPLNGPQAAGWDLYASSPVIVGRTVVIGAGDGGIEALDLATGARRWRVQTGGRVRGTPAVADGQVVVGSFDGRVYALDLATGRERWVHRTIGDTLDSKRFGYDRRALQSSPAIVDGMVFVGSRDGGLYALDAVTGERRWRATHRGSWVVGSPAVRDGIAYVGSSDGHFIHAVDVKTGADVWRRPTGANVLSSPLLAGDALVVGTMRTNAPWGDLLALDARTGEIRWSLRTDAAINASPVLADGEIYLGTDDGSVLAIHETNPEIPRLAVYYDPALAARSRLAGAALAYRYFQQLGYDTLDVRGLAGFLEARVADGRPSAVVFAMDALPDSLLRAPAGAGLLRRYLDAGGKVVWLGAPIGAAVYDSTGQVVGMDPRRTEQLIGVSMASFDFDVLPAEPTRAGRQWGLEKTVLGHFTMDPAAIGTPLALDELGRATAWVHRYRTDRPASGFVQLWGHGVTVDRLPMIRAAAEYGLRRSASHP